MTTLIAILMILFTLWLFQALITMGLNSLYTVRLPFTFKDFLKLTFLPYVVYHLIYDKESLKQ